MHWASACLRWLSLSCACSPLLCAAASRSCSRSPAHVCSARPSTVRWIWPCQGGGGTALSPCHLPSSATAPPGGPAPPHGPAPCPRLPVTPAQHPWDQCLQVSTRGASTQGPSTPSTSPIAPAPMAPAIPVQHPEPQYPQFGTHDPSTHGPSMPSSAPVSPVCPVHTHLCLQLQHPLPQRPQLSLCLCLAQACGQHRVLQRVGVAAPRGLLPAPPRTARLHPEGTGCWEQGVQVVGQGDLGGCEGTQMAGGGTRGWDKGPKWPKGDPGIMVRAPGGHKGAAGGQEGPQALGRGTRGGQGGHTGVASPASCH